ncbi:MAG: hypothetical protein EHM50_00505, partial [Lysobacterales bacterium]
MLWSTALLASIPACASKANSCEQVEEIELEDEEPSPDGPTGSEVLMLVSSSSQPTLEWQAGITNAEAGNTQLSMTFERNAASVRYSRSEQVGTGKADLGCGPHLLVPVIARVSTEDGALDEIFDAEIVYATDDGPVSAQSSASMRVDFGFDEIEGWLQPAA